MFSNRVALGRVDGVEYVARMKAARTTAFLGGLERQVGLGAISLGCAYGYRPLHLDCHHLLTDLVTDRGTPRPVVLPRSRVWENMRLLAFRLRR